MQDRIKDKKIQSYLEIQRTKLEGIKYIYLEFQKEATERIK